MKKYTEEEIRSMSKAERNDLYNVLSNKLDEVAYSDDRSEWDETYEQYNLLNSIEDEIYREENYEKFREYEKKMGEPDFDWDYYSDWHKDMYGYRPHKQIIPKDDAERRAICEQWHRERGL